MNPTQYATRPQAARESNSNDGGIERTRSIFSATRSSLSNEAYPTPTEPLLAREQTLLQRLPDAKLALRYEAILDALSHISKHVVIREYNNYATASLPTVFAAVRPIEERAFEVGVALPSTEDELLTPCLGEWSDSAILSKFTVRDNEPLSGKHLRFMRLASRAVTQ